MSHSADKAEYEKPFLSFQLQEKLQNLPHGLRDQKSLFLRYRHIESVHFLGGGAPSWFSFKRGQSILMEGLSMRLMRKPHSPWSKAVIKFKKPVDAHRYNSLVVWVWTSKPGLRLGIGAENHIKVRTGALPFQGFPPNEPVQLVVPYARLAQNGRFDWGIVDRLVLEYGMESDVDATGAIQVLGVAFVQQEIPLKQSVVVLGRSSAKVVLAEPLQTVEADDSAPPAAREPAPLPPESRLAKMVNKFRSMSDQESSDYFKNMGLNAPAPQPNATSVKAVAPAAPITGSAENITVQPYSQKWPAETNAGPAPKSAFADVQPAPVPEPPPTAPTPPIAPVARNVAWISLLAFILAALWFIVRRRRPYRPATASLGKIVHEIHWPFLTTVAVLNKKVEQEFWKGVGIKHDRDGWLSTTGMIIDNTSSHEYFGESFLKRQAAIAAQQGFRLFPSLSFTRNLVRKDTLASGLGWSVDAFRALAIDTLLRFSANVQGVRIENAADLLNIRLRRKPTDPELWTEIIQVVRAKHPNLLFIADAAGDHAKHIREVGFDYYENDRLPDVLLEQIKDGRVSDTRAFLKGEAAHELPKSIYNLDGLFKSHPRKENDRQQHLLAAGALTLLPGLIQHSRDIPDDLINFIDEVVQQPVLRKGHFLLLETGSPALLAWARWNKKSVFIVAVNFSSHPQQGVVSLAPFEKAIDKNKLYLFDNALHGTGLLKSLSKSGDADAPAVALWGQNICDIGLPVALPALSLTLFSVSLSRAVTPPLKPAVRSDDKLAAVTPAET